MGKLTDMHVHRKGGTAREFGHATSDCGFFASNSPKSMGFVFTIPSKGGGDTNIWLSVGVGDFAAILEECADKIPEIAGILSDAAARANKRNLALLEAEKATSNLAADKAELTVSQLEPIQRYLFARCFELPSGTLDDTLHSLKQEIDAAIKRLRSIQ